MTSIHDLPSELLLLVMEHCDHDLISLIRAYPTALALSSKRRNNFTKPLVARMLIRSGDLPPCPFLLTARLHHAKQKQQFDDPSAKAVEAKLKEVFNLYMRSGPCDKASSHRYSLSALCSMRSLSETMRRTVDPYAQQAVELRLRHNAKLAELKRSERSPIMTAGRIWKAAVLLFAVETCYSMRRVLPLDQDDDFDPYTIHRIVTRCTCCPLSDIWYTTAFWVMLGYNITRCSRVLSNKSKRPPFGLPLPVW